MLNIIIALLCSVAFFIGSESYFSNVLIESKYRLLIQGFFPVDSEFTVFSEDDSANRTVIKKLEIKGKAPNVDQLFIINLHGKPVNRLGLEFVAPQHISPNGSIQFHFIEIENSFTNDVLFRHTEIKSNFISDQFAGDEANRLDYGTDNTITLKTNGLISPPNPIFTKGIPLFLTFMVFLLLTNNSLTNLPAYRDMGIGRAMTNSAEFDAINGLRGLSALLVLLSHTAPGFESIYMGLALLFVMSGFLLAKPFVLTTSKIFSAQNIYRYLVKRTMRILPMYYFTGCLLYLVTFEFDTAARHFLFVEARGHLWAIPQILSFYMILPIILIVTSLTHKIHRVFPVVLLVASIFAWDHYVPFGKIFYNGRYHTPFMLDSFLLGVTISYIQYGLIQPSEKIRNMFNSNAVWISLTALAVTFLSIAWSAPVAPPESIADLIARFDVKCFLSALIILLAVNIPHSFFAKVIGNPIFRSIGIIGFSFYLLQGLGIQMVLKFQDSIIGHMVVDRRSWEMFLIVLAITYLSSLFTYSYVERPFFGKKLKK